MTAAAKAIPFVPRVRNGTCITWTKNAAWRIEMQKQNMLLRWNRLRAIISCKLTRAHDYSKSIYSQIRNVIKYLMKCHLQIIEKLKEIRKTYVEITNIQFCRILIYLMSIFLTRGLFFPMKLSRVLSRVNDYIEFGDWISDKRHFFFLETLCVAMEETRLSAACLWFETGVVV